MRITQEADYALRIVSLLAVSDSIRRTAELAEETGVPPRFAPKILRKLMQGNIVCSFPGVKGGYRLCADPHTLTMLDVIELVDEPLAISKCADDDYICSKNGQKKDRCIYHCIFRQLAADIADKMRRLTIAEIMDPQYEMHEILNKIK